VKKLRLSPNTTVSGLSAGGYMAAQMAVTFSASIVGAGIMAGGPYYCAQGSLSTALTNCLSYNGLLDTAALVSQAQSFAGSGDIDGLGNVTRQAYYLYSGQSDYTVGKGAVQAVGTVMSALGTPAANIVSEFSVDGGHGVPTLSYGVQCSSTATPYINSCAYDGAGAVFQQLYGASVKRTKQIAGNWQKLSTADYLPSGVDADSISLGDSIFVYVPTNCAAGSLCSLMLVFHGCEQSVADISDDFYKHTGYAEWAESSSVVLAFPQAVANQGLQNPDACFDWWGYTSNYATRSAPQMVTFKNLAIALGAPFI
jgi:poly(3-hydroxybutyrate) depolymerase